MRLKDIEVGKEYAKQRGSYGWARRVRITEVGVHRSVSSPYSFRHKSCKADGVRYVYVNEKGKAGDRVYETTGRNIIQLWEPYEREESARKALQKVQRENREQRDSARRAGANRCQSHLHARGITATTTHIAGHLELDPDNVRRLCSLLEALNDEKE